MVSIILVSVCHHIFSKKYWIELSLMAAYTTHFIFVVLCFFSWQFSRHSIFYLQVQALTWAIQPFEPKLTLICLFFLWLGTGAPLQCDSGVFFVFYCSSSAACHWEGMCLFKSGVAVLCSGLSSSRTEGCDHQCYDLCKSECGRQGYFPPKKNELCHASQLNQSPT